QVTQTVDPGTGVDPTVTTTTVGDKTYTPDSGYRYGWSIAQAQFIRRYNTSATSSWIGVFHLPAPGDVDWQRTENVGQPVVVGEGPYFYKDTSLSSTDYTYNFNTVVAT